MKKWRLNIFELMIQNKQVYNLKSNQAPERDMGKTQLLSLHSRENTKVFTFTQTPDNKL